MKTTANFTHDHWQYAAQATGMGVEGLALLISLHERQQVFVSLHHVGFKAESRPSRGATPVQLSGHQRLTALVCLLHYWNSGSRRLGRHGELPRARVRSALRALYGNLPAELQLLPMWAELRLLADPVSDRQLPLLVPGARESQPPQEAQLPSAKAAVSANSQPGHVASASVDWDDM